MMILWAMARITSTKARKVVQDSVCSLHSRINWTVVRIQIPCPTKIYENLQ